VIIDVCTGSPNHLYVASTSALFKPVEICMIHVSVILQSQQGSWPDSVGHNQSNIWICLCLDPLRRVSSVAFVPYGPVARLLLGCDDGTARCWDWQAGNCLAAAKAKSKAELTAVVTPIW
jgi:WD40 repeat protein